MQLGLLRTRTPGLYLLIHARFRLQPIDKRSDDLNLQLTTNHIYFKQIRYKFINLDKLKMSNENFSIHGYNLVTLLKRYVSLFDS